MMANLEVCDYSYILTNYMDCCVIISLRGGDISPSLLVWVATFIISMPIILINYVGKGPPYFTYLNVKAMALTWFALVSCNESKLEKFKILKKIMDK